MMMAMIMSAKYTPQGETVPVSYHAQVTYSQAQ